MASNQSTKGNPSSLTARNKKEREKKEKEIISSITGFFNPSPKAKPKRKDNEFMLGKKNKGTERKMSMKSQSGNPATQTTKKKLDPVVKTADKPLTSVRGGSLSVRPPVVKSSKWRVPSVKNNTNKKKATTVSEIVKQKRDPRNIGSNEATQGKKNKGSEQTMSMKSQAWTKGGGKERPEAIYKNRESGNKTLQTNAGRTRTRQNIRTPSNKPTSSPDSTIGNWLAKIVSSNTDKPKAKIMSKLDILKGISTPKSKSNIPPNINPPISKTMPTVKSVSEMKIASGGDPKRGDPKTTVSKKPPLAKKPPLVDTGDFAQPKPEDYAFNQPTGNGLIPKGIKEAPKSKLRKISENQTTRTKRPTYGDLDPNAMPDVYHTEMPEIRQGPIGKFIMGMLGSDEKKKKRNGNNGFRNK
jgi:hypothetical protein